MCSTPPRSERTQAKPRPRWGALYAIPAIAMTSLGVAEFVAAGDLTRMTLRVATVLGTFVALGVWVHRQRAAFDLDDWCECAGQHVIVREIPSCAPAVPEPDLVPVAEERDLVLTRS